MSPPTQPRRNPNVSHHELCRGSRRQLSSRAKLDPVFAKTKDTRSVAPPDNPGRLSPRGLWQQRSDSARIATLTAHSADVSFSFNRNVQGAPV
jgi:hypothetical protein